MKYRDKGGAVSQNVFFSQADFAKHCGEPYTKIVFDKGLHDFKSHLHGKKGLLQEIFWENKPHLSSVMDVEPERKAKAFFRKGKDEKE